MQKRCQWFRGDFFTLICYVQHVKTGVSAVDLHQIARCCFYVAAKTLPWWNRYISKRLEKIFSCRIEANNRSPSVVSTFCSLWTNFDSSPGLYLQILVNSAERGLSNESVLVRKHCGTYGMRRLQHDRLESAVSRLRTACDVSSRALSFLLHTTMSRPLESEVQSRFLFHGWSSLKR